MRTLMCAVSGGERIYYTYYRSKSRSGEPEVDKHPEAVPYGVTHVDLMSLYFGLASTVEKCEEHESKHVHHKEAQNQLARFE